MKRKEVWRELYKSSRFILISHKSTTRCGYFAELFLLKFARLFDGKTLIFFFWSFSYSVPKRKKFNEITLIMHKNKVILFINWKKILNRGTLFLIYLRSSNDGNSKRIRNHENAMKEKSPGKRLFKGSIPWRFTMKQKHPFWTEPLNTLKLIKIWLFISIEFYEGVCKQYRWPASCGWDQLIRLKSILCRWDVSFCHLFFFFRQHTIATHLSQVKLLGYPFKKISIF